VISLLGPLEWSICAAIGRCSRGDDVGVPAVSSLERDEGQQDRADCRTDHGRADVNQGRGIPASHETDKPNRDDEKDCTHWRPDGHRPECATVPSSFTRTLIA
jgi:hypothetical protein